jgi:magnesium chelatase subunit D
MAAQARRQGLSPFLACLTDGRGNIALDGTPGREAALEDAHTVAARLRGGGLPALLIDTAARPGPQGAGIAAAMGARYLALPRADATRLSAAIGAARDDLAG